jgi:hypothetical protein
VKKALATERRAHVQDLPEFKYRTALQCAIQILKRQRDLRYGGNDDKPTSVLVTTLAALAYDGDASLDSALTGIVARMSGFIEVRDGVHWVPNPVSPAENFADKWSETPVRKDIVFEWLASLDDFCGRLRESNGLDELRKSLNENVGVRDATEVLSRFEQMTEGRRFIALSKSTALAPRNVALVPSALHAKRPSWPVNLGGHSVSLSCEASRRGFRSQKPKSGARFAKNLRLRFRASTSVPKPYEVHWQVVNTGSEARAHDCLRGEFYPDEAQRGGLTREESTLYSGTHWVECFIVKNRVVVARSGPFIVEIE